MHYTGAMRSYGQYCALAKALDVLGDRWTLLIVRELMLARAEPLHRPAQRPAGDRHQPARPDRLRELEAAGVVAREQAPPPVATTLFSPHAARAGSCGRCSTSSATGACRSWSTGRRPATPSAAAGWPGPPSASSRTPNRPALPSRSSCARARIPSSSKPSTAVYRARPAEPGDEPDATLSGSPHAILGLLSGQIAPAEARRKGLRIEGEESVLARLRPVPELSAG